MPSDVAAHTNVAKLAKPQTVVPGGMPSSSAGGCQVAPSSIEWKTPLDAVPASIVPPGSEMTACTASLRRVGWSGVGSAPWAIGVQVGLVAADALCENSPPSVPAKTLPLLV